MLELYLLLSSLVLIIMIIWHRKWIAERLKKLEFRRQGELQLETLKKEEQESAPQRFRDRFNEQKEKKPDDPKANELFRKADMALAQGKIKEAEALLIQSLALTSDKRPALRLLAHAYREQGNLSRAQNLYEELLQLDFKQPEIHENLARIHMKHKKIKEAISAYVKAVELDEQNDRLFFALGQLYQLLMRHSLAAECFRRAAELRPREVEYIFLLAEACLADEDFDNALAAYEKILSIEPYNEKAKTRLSVAKHKRKESEVIWKEMLQKQKFNLTLKP